MPCFRGCCTPHSTPTSWLELKKKTLKKTSEKLPETTTWFTFVGEKKYKDEFKRKTWFYLELEIMVWIFHLISSTLAENELKQSWYGKVWKMLMLLTAESLRENKESLMGDGLQGCSRSCNRRLDLMSSAHIECTNRCPKQVSRKQAWHS